MFQIRARSICFIINFPFQQFRVLFCLLYYFLTPGSIAKRQLYILFIDITEAEIKYIGLSHCETNEIFTGMNTGAMQTLQISPA